MLHLYLAIFVILVSFDIRNECVTFGKLSGKGQYLSFKYVRRINDEVHKGLSPSKLQNTTPRNLRNFPPRNVRNFPPRNVRNFPPRNVRKFPVRNLQIFTARNLQVSTPRNVQSSTTSRNLQNSPARKMVVIPAAPKITKELKSNFNGMVYPQQTHVSKLLGVFIRQKSASSRGQKNGNSSTAELFGRSFSSPMLFVGKDVKTAISNGIPISNLQAVTQTNETAPTREEIKQILESFGQLDLLQQFPSVANHMFNITTKGQLDMIGSLASHNNLKILIEQPASFIIVLRAEGTPSQIRTLETLMTTSWISEVAESPEVMEQALNASRNPAIAEFIQKLSTTDLLEEFVDYPIAFKMITDKVLTGLQKDAIVTLGLGDMLQELIENPKIFDQVLNYVTNGSRIQLIVALSHSGDMEYLVASPHLMTLVLNNAVLQPQIDVLITLSRVDLIQDLLLVPHVLEEILQYSNTTANGKFIETLAQTGQLDQVLTDPTLFVNCTETITGVFSRKTKDSNYYNTLSMLRGVISIYI